MCPGIHVLLCLHVLLINFINSWVIIISMINLLINSCARTMSGIWSLFTCTDRVWSPSTSALKPKMEQLMANYGFTKWSNKGLGTAWKLLFYTSWSNTERAGPALHTFQRETMFKIRWVLQMAESQTVQRPITAERKEVSWKQSSESQSLSTSSAMGCMAY